MVERAQLTTKTSEAKRENSASKARKIESPQAMSSPVDQVLHLQRTIGNQAVQRLIKSGALQAKLRIGLPGDKYEQEADRVADAVMRMPKPKVVTRQTGNPSECSDCGSEELRRQPEEEEEEEQVQTKPVTDQITPLVQVQRQKKPEEEETLQSKPISEEINPLVQRQIEPVKEEEEIQAKTISGHISEVNPNIESHIQSLKGRGQPLSEKDRTFFEPRFGRDFSQVRVHTDAAAAESARAVNARAFAVGRGVMFGAGQYAPGTSEGRRLMAHELTHVLQQSKQSNIPIVQLWPREVYTEMILARQRRELLAILERAIDRYARQYTVPANLLRGIIHFETMERGLLETVGELYRIARRDWRVSLGPGDVQVRRAAEILHPGRNWTRNPLTPQEFNSIVGQLGTPNDHARILAMTMQDNFRYYGQQPGKTLADRWRFAIARHKAGHGPIGTAQVRARSQGGNINSWSDVSQYMDESIVEFVNNASGYTDARLRRNPYD